MGRSWLSPYWVTTTLAGLCVVLVGVDAALFVSNEAAQADVNQRQQILNQAPQLGRLNDVLMRALADAELNTKDDQLRDMLARHGFTATPGK
jgi:hypothetical protein